MKVNINYENQVIFDYIHIIIILFLYYYCQSDIGVIIILTTFYKYKRYNKIDVIRE